MKEKKIPIQSLIDHIKTAIDVDPWAKEMAEELLKEPIEHGKYAEWVEDSDPGETIGAHWACSNCKLCFGQQAPWNPIEWGWNYCPSCGASMKRIKYT